MILRAARFLTGLFFSLLAVLILPGIIIAIEDHQVVSIMQSETEIPESITIPVGEELADDSMVEVLILLRDQVDTDRIAREIKEKLILLNATVRGKKNLIRFAVVDALQKQAEMSQAPILGYLAEEKVRGRVDNYKSFFIVNLIFATISEEIIDQIAKFPEVKSVKDNEYFQLIDPIEGFKSVQCSSIEWNIERIKAPSVWAAGIDGSGVVVGIIDTGVDWQHDALRHKYRGYNPADEKNPIHSYNWFDPHYDNFFPDDRHGHGSHVTGIVLGADPVSKYHIGVAPGAQWVAARAFNDNGVTSEAHLLDAGQFMLAPTPNPDGSGTPDPSMAPDIINNSWGGRIPGEFNEWYRPMVQNWRSAEILPVFAAGNKGPDAATISNPGNYPESFTVAATDNENKLASFSSRGPTPYPVPDDLKPDISAPGVKISSVQSWSPDRERGYMIASGTSMAAPHISGMAALLLHSNPELFIVQLEEIICKTALPLKDALYSVSPNYGYGYGLVEAHAAVNGWVKFSPSTAVAMSYGDMTGDGLSNFVASFPSGTWYIGDGKWERVTTSTAHALTFADINGDGIMNLVASFDSGTWYIKDNDWVRLTPSTAVAMSYGDMTGDGLSNFVAAYPSGTWYREDFIWIRISKSNAFAITFADKAYSGILNFVVSYPSGSWYRWR